MSLTQKILLFIGAMIVALVAVTLAFTAALAAFPVTHLETTRPSLEDVFLTYYQADDAHTEER